MVHIFIMFIKNIKRLQSYGAKMLLILFIAKGYNSLTIIHGVKVVFSACYPIMVYLSTKFRENILNDFRVMERTQFQCYYNGA